MDEPERKELLEDLEKYFEIRQKRIQKENPSKNIGSAKPKVLFIDTLETNNLFPDGDEIK
ncbi:hypothetical protein [Paenibacillus alba]|uniref:Uncharacterized protein n=1 Tax=Paenibacillus alba TaxID=1197127 RepID=A0ABU6GET5_9BACL|nr:hypothetical protein [Paenibacillus alba]MEC0231268.1 hypothetical protein [Paenibacillus alba]